MTITVSINGGTPLYVYSPSIVPVVVESLPSTPIYASAVGVVGPAGPAGADGADGADGAPGADGVGIPAGGATGEALVKSSATDYDTEWTPYAFPLADGLERQVLVNNGTGALEFDYVRSTYLKIQNDSGVTMTAGTAVYPKGITGDSVLVGKAINTSASTMPAIGVLLEETLAGGTGYIITSGNFNKTINGLSGVVVGQKVYVSTTGIPTNVKPVASNQLVQNIGTVLQTNGSNIQKMKVSAIDRSNDVPNLSDGRFFIGDSTYGWVSSPYRLPVADGSANQFLKTDGAGSVTFTSIIQATGNELENIVEDTTPQLGGTLETQGNPINHSAGVALQYGGATKLLTQSTGIRTSGTINVNNAYSLPTADGSSGDSMVTDGAGTISFVNTSTIQVTGVTVLSSAWSLVGSFYEADISNGNILSTSIVDVIPSNADYSTVTTAQVLPATSSSSGSVKIYAVNSPGADITVTLNISRSQ